MSLAASVYLRALAALFLVIMSNACISQGLQTGPDGNITYNGKGYTAVFSAEYACLSGLRAAGEELIDQRRFYRWCSQRFQPGYFTSEWDLREAVYGGSMQAEDGKVVCAVPDMGVVTYTPEPDRITVAVTNTSGSPNHFLTAFTSAIAAVGHPVTDGRIVSPGTVWQPGAALEPARYKWVLREAGFVSEGDALWEQTPYTLTSMMAHLALEPGETKSFVIAPYVPAREDRAAVQKKAEPAPGLELLSPRDWQVFQRRDKLAGSLLISGRINARFDKAFYRITGKGLSGRSFSGKWQQLSAPEGSFDLQVEGPAGGWYRVEVRAELRGETVAEAAAERVGIGEVIVGAGQSNSTNWGQELIEQTSGMVSMTDGVLWQRLEGAVIGPHDRSGGGSYYAALGDRLYEEFGVPVGIASTGHGGSIVEHWGPGGELYEYMTERLRQLGKGGCRALLWHQGESNANCDSDAIYEAMKTIIETSRQDAGWYVPWFVAKVSYNNAEAPMIEPIRRVHQRLWDTGVALEGPDTDLLTGDARDYDGAGIHFSKKGLRAHGEMWADKLIPYIHSCIDKP